MLFNNEADLEDYVCREAQQRWDVPNVKLNLTGNTGWPDRWFLVPCAPLLIEFKQPGEPLSQRQRLIHIMLLTRGYNVQTHADADKALQAIKHAVDSARIPEKGYQVLATELLSGLISRSRAGQNKRNPRRRKSAP